MPDIRALEVIMLRIGMAIAFLLALLTAGCSYGSKYNGMGSGMPIMAKLQPDSVMAGGAAFSLVVMGSGFGTDAVVYFNGNPNTTMYNTTAQVTATISADEIMNAGMIPIYVRSGGMNSNTIDFTVQ
jgi:hypothetical protein